MGISRSSKNKRRLTGGRMPIHRKKRKFEMGRQASMTKLGEKKVINVRGRGGNIKRRALKLNEGNFCWISEQVTKKCKIVEVIYNATNNELVRTQTLVKNSIVAVDPTPFKYYNLCTNYNIRFKTNQEKRSRLRYRKQTSGYQCREGKGEGQQRQLNFLPKFEF